MRRWNATERMLLTHLHGRALTDPQGPTYPELEAALGVSRRTLQRAVRRLAKARLVKAPSRSRGKAWTEGRVSLVKR